MHAPRRFHALSTPRVTLALAVSCLLATPSALHAQKKRPNPASKVYISDVGGEAQIDTGESIEDISKRSVYEASGTVIETKKAEDVGDRRRAFSTMVYSNGTGAFFDADTRVEVRRFIQEPFTPNRTDVEMEPSISQTQAFIARGIVGLCTSKLVSGTTMTYQTAHGSVNIRGRKIVIETNPQVTKISMLEGDSTVKAGSMDMGGHTIHAGEQAIIRPGALGQPNSVEILKIPEGETVQLDDKVSMACLAKRTVYFEVREKPERAGSQSGGEGAVTAFDGNTAKPETPALEIVPVEVVPVNLPVQITLSASRIETPPKPGK